MKKAWYAFRHILPVFRGRILMLWIFILYSSFLLTYFFTIWQTQQTYLAHAPSAEGMRDYLLVNAISYEDMTAEDFTARRDAIEAVEGVECLAGVYALFCQQNGVVTFAYPTALLNQMALRDEGGQLIHFDAEGAEVYPVWVDSRLKGQLPIGTPLSFGAWSGYTDQRDDMPASYCVAGYLNRDHFTLNWSGLIQSDPSLQGIMDTGYYGMAMLTISDAIDRNPAYDVYMPQVLVVQTEAQADQAAIRDTLQQKGIGTCYPYAEVAGNTGRYASSFLSGTAGNLCYLLPMSLLAMFGMQQLLIGRLRRTRAVLTLYGMAQSVWVGAWLMAISFMTALPSVLGHGLFVLLQQMSMIYPLAQSVIPSLLWLPVILLIQYFFGLVGLIPTIRAKTGSVSIMDEDGGTL